jgi:hypothetical protein
MHRNNVAEAHPQVLANYFVHADLPFFAEFVSQNDAHGILALLALDEHSVTAKQLKLVHFLQIQGHDTVVVVHGFICGADRKNNMSDCFSRKNSRSPQKYNHDWAVGWHDVWEL